MIIKRYTLNHFRNIKKADLKLESGLNLIWGVNGSGKTALLEGLHFLNTGRSFRTSISDHLIHHDQTECTLAAELADSDQQTTRIALQKSKRHDIEMRVNHEKVSKWSELARWIPIQTISPESFALLLEGPKMRRAFIDWGIFYQYPEYHKLWSIQKKLLKQRNALLKQQKSQQDMLPWNQQFAQYAEKLTQYRKSYINSLNEALQGIIDKFLPQFTFVTEYHLGWDKNYPIAEVLNIQYERDKITGYTHSGPHKADLKISIDGRPAQQVLSRGQLKLLVCALKLAQGVLLHQETRKHALFLIDDLPSELDQQHRLVLLQQLKAIGAQQLVTTIEPKAMTNVLSQTPAKVFHVEHGQVSEHK